MNLNQVFDTLVYGKGTATRNHYFMYCSVKSLGTKTDKGTTKEVIERTYFIQYKGNTVLVISERGTRFNFDKELVYRITTENIKNNNFNPLINKTLDRIECYLLKPASVYNERYVY